MEFLFDFLKRYEEDMNNWDSKKYQDEIIEIIDHLCAKYNDDDDEFTMKLSFQLYGKKVRDRNELKEIIRKPMESEDARNYPPTSKKIKMSHV